MPLKPGAPSPVSSLPNLRDLGGYRGHGGRVVVSDRLYRSTDFRSMATADLPTFESLGVRTIYDLRSEAERTALPDPALPDVADIHLDVLADSETAVPANLQQFFSDPETVKMASRELAGGKAADAIAATYRGMVSLPSAVRSYRGYYQGLLGEYDGPSLFHCTTGKDRTGWAAASLLALLGVDKDDIYHDYMLTNERLIPALKPIFDDFAAAGGDPDVLLPILGVDPSYLDGAFDEVRQKYSDIEGYFVAGLGFDDAALTTLRDTYLVSA